jgi:hypothetical protein
MSAPNSVSVVQYFTSNTIVVSLEVRNNLRLPSVSHYFTKWFIALDGLVVVCLLLHPWFAGSDPAEGDGIFKRYKNLNSTSFGGK